MRTYRMTLEYEGTRYKGWQRQSRDLTVQQVVEEARSATALSPERLRRALNAVLPEDIAVLDVRITPNDFHARFSARGKTYRYSILNDRQRRVFGRETHHRESRPLDVEAMRAAADRLVGRHDFAAFTCSGGEPGTTVRTLHRLDVRRDGCSVTVEAVGNGFLYKMVRSIVGTLLEVGRGERTADDVEATLGSRDRTRAGPSAPARGLTLQSVEYDDPGEAASDADREVGASREPSSGEMEVVP